jgi:single-strand DNA-binding protein
MNEVFMIGRSGAKAELRYIPNGTPVLNLSIAVNEKTKDEVRASWFKIVAFGKSAEIIAPRIQKGTEVFVKGRIFQKSWDDKTTGQKRYGFEIVAHWIKAIDNGPSPTSAYDNQPTMTHHEVDFNESDIPF